MCVMNEAGGRLLVGAGDFSYTMSPLVSATPHFISSRLVSSHPILRVIQSFNNKMDYLIRKRCPVEAIPIPDKKTKKTKKTATASESREFAVSRPGVHASGLIFE